MQIVFLPGYSLKNKDEEVVISSFLETQGYKVYQHHWSHWMDESIPWNSTEEVKKVLSEISTSQQSEIGIIAKSIGTYVAVQLIKELKNMKIKFLILMGVPSFDLDIDEKEIYKLLSSESFPIYLIQNRNDNHGDIDSVHEVLSGVKYTELVKESSDHSYSYPQDILDLVKNVI